MAEESVVIYSLPTCPGLNGWDTYVDLKDSRDCVIDMIVTGRGERWTRSWVPGDHVVGLRGPSPIHETGVALYRWR